MKCSFCNTSKKEVRILIASKDNKKHICEKCVKESVKALKRDEIKSKKYLLLINEETTEVFTYYQSSFGLAKPKPEGRIIIDLSSMENLRKIEKIIR